MKVLSPEEIDALSRLNDKVRDVCWSHDDHRPGEIRDEDDDVVAVHYGGWRKDSAAFVVAAKNSMDELLAAARAVVSLARERDEAREWVQRLTSTERVLTCVYCGHAYPPGTPAHGSPVLTAHIAECEKHPMHALAAAARHLARLMDTRKQTQADQDAIDRVRVLIGETISEHDA